MVSGKHRSERLAMQLPPRAARKFEIIKGALETNAPVYIELENVVVAEAAFDMAIEFLEQKGYFKTEVAATTAKAERRISPNANKGTQTDPSFAGVEESSQSRTAFLEAGNGLLVCITQAPDGSLWLDPAEDL